MKLCNGRCGQTLEDTAFGRRSPQKHLLRSRCLSCEAADRRDRYAAQPALLTAQVRRAEEKVKDAILARYGRSCACCGATADLTIDETVPGTVPAHAPNHGDIHWLTRYREIIRAGYPAGLSVYCRACNSSKHRGSTCRLVHPLAA